MCLIAVSHPDRITEVKTNIYVTSFGPVSDTDMVRADTGHVFILYNYSPNTTTPDDSLFTQTLRKKRCLFCFILSVVAFPPFIIALSPSLSLHTQHNTEVGRVFHTTARCLFIWLFSSYKLLKVLLLFQSLLCLSWAFLFIILKHAPTFTSHHQHPLYCWRPIFQVIDLLI